MWAHLAARREPAGGPEQAAKCAICFERKTKNILIHAPHTCIMVFWHISNIQKDFIVKFVMIPQYFI